MGGVEAIPLLGVDLVGVLAEPKILVLLVGVDCRLPLECGVGEEGTGLWRSWE